MEITDISIQSFFELEGNSMRPYYCRGKVIAQPCTPEEMRRGEILMFRYDGNNVCHRIIRRDGEKLTMQGDGNLYKQEQINVSDVIGIVHTIIKPNGDLVSTQTRAARIYWKIWLRLPTIVKRVALRILKEKKSSGSHSITQ